MVTIEALKCSGFGTDWIGLNDVIPVVPFQAGQHGPLVTEAANAGSVTLPAISFPPPSPPPRDRFASI